MKRRRVFLYVQHLLGIGHLRRAVTLANALAAEGLEVTLASGGFAVPDLRLDGVRFVQLPPAGAADSSFKVLVDGEGKPVDEEWKIRRREHLLDAWRVADPHVLALELYPFGRRQMRFELVPLLDAALRAERRPAIVCSVRDVIGGGQKAPSRQDEMLEIFERYFDRVLVHGDADVIPFGRTFRHAGSIGQRLHYTGYVVEDPLPTGGFADKQGEGEVIVSAGGGAVGRHLLETAIQARRHSTLADRTWRVLGGVNAAGRDLADLTRIARDIGDGQVIVERFRADFPRLLANCALSINQGGYNTLMEILQARARCVVVPFAADSETEQTLRARALAERGLLDVVAEDALTPESLAAAVDRASMRPRPALGAVNLDGARHAAALVAAWASEVAW